MNFWFATSVVYHPQPFGGIVDIGNRTLIILVQHSHVPLQVQIDTQVVCPMDLCEALSRRHVLRTTLVVDDCCLLRNAKHIPCDRPTSVFAVPEICVGIRFNGDAVVYQLGLVIDLTKVNRASQVSHHLFSHHIVLLGVATSESTQNLNRMCNVWTRARHKIL
ncbi:hypothetical protein PsorP6_006048 [Peronosclerospora sorghi]|uniref:Uncharacterized protein n=1 Tax=Peronosclerospora sorghi TaxID=230839 RepID=A0ACC0W729_9STRA|nr:hypothetical protein PsorP6_006048 [Peronosclerospora sorghi]